MEPEAQLNASGGDLATTGDEPPRIAPEGAKYIPDYGRRRVRTIPIAMHELRYIGFLNNFASGFFAFGSFCAGILLNIVVGALLAGDLDSRTQDFLWVGGVASGVVGAISIVLAVLMLRLRGSAIRDMEGEATFSD